jgi:hypothetical protein
MRIERPRLMQAQRIACNVSEPKNYDAGDSNDLRRCALHKEVRKNEKQDKCDERYESCEELGVTCRQKFCHAIENEIAAPENFMRR